MQLAQAGMTGPNQVFEGRDGFFNRCRWPVSVIANQEAIRISMSPRDYLSGSKPRMHNFEAVVDLLLQIQALRDASR
jgi:hypothetical protein